MQSPNWVYTLCCSNIIYQGILTHSNVTSLQPTKLTILCSKSISTVGEVMLRTHAAVLTLVNHKKYTKVGKDLNSWF